jgi:hypothetical protein
MFNRLSFRLIKPKALDILRYGTGSYVKGRWVAGNTTTLPIKALVTPVIKQAQLMLLPEVARDKRVLRLYSNTPLLTFEGKQQEQSDEFIYNTEKFRIVKLGDWTDVNGFTGYEAYAYKLDILDATLP